MECSVCTETFTKKRAKISCANCHYEACVVCIKQFLLGATIEPHCMNCRHEWNREFLDANFTRSWISGELRRHRQNLLWDRERSLLPATQPAVEVTLQIRHIKEVEIPRLKQRSIVAKQQINILARGWFDEKYSAHFDKECDNSQEAYDQFSAVCAHSAEYYIANVRQIPAREPCATCKASLKERIPVFRKLWTDLTLVDRKARVLLTETQRTLFRIEYRLKSHIRDGDALTEDGEGEGEVKERRQFVAACPSEDCRGFSVLPTSAESVRSSSAPPAANSRQMIMNVILLWLKPLRQLLRIVVPAPHVALLSRRWMGVIRCIVLCVLPHSPIARVIR